MQRKPISPSEWQRLTKINPEDLSRKVPLGIQQLMGPILIFLFMQLFSILVFAAELLLHKYYSKSTIKALSTAKSGPGTNI